MSFIFRILPEAQRGIFYRLLTLNHLLIWLNRCKGTPLLWLFLCLLFFLFTLIAGGATTRHFEFIVIWSFVNASWISVVIFALLQTRICSIFVVVIYIDFIFTMIWACRPMSRARIGNIVALIFLNKVWIVKVQIRGSVGWGCWLIDVLWLFLVLHFLIV